MTEDEAFVRAVVGSPGDDTPRLVYADWLDDRDDPRAAYLRAEREAVRTGDVAKLRELAVGLDPVWVARVSRPPIGVCCDHIPTLGIQDEHGFGSGPALTADDLSAFEVKHQIALPLDYSAFMLNHNGGRTPTRGPIPLCRVDIPAAVHPEDNHPWDTRYDVGDFMVLPPKEGIPAGVQCPDEVWLNDDNMMYIADDGIGGSRAGFYLGLGGSRRGRVFYYQKNLEVWYPLVAPSFAEFLAAITLNIKEDS